MTDCWDAIVIGGGLAGAAASITLAGSKRRILLLEKETEPHHKICGEFISFEAQHYFNQLGINIDALGAVPIDCMELIQRKRCIAAPLPFLGKSLSRRTLDEALLQQATLCGVVVQRGVTVTNVMYNDAVFNVLVGDTTYQTPVVFHATGKRDLKAFQRGNGVQENYIGFKMYWKLTADETQKLKNKVRIIWFKGGYAGLELVEDGLANLCLLVSKRRFAALGKQWSVLLAAIQQEVPSLASCLAGASPCWEQPMAIFGIPYGYVHKDSPSMKGMYRLGDQMAVIPSFCGDGMAIALHTGVVAAENMLKGESAYHTRMRAELLPQIRKATLLSIMISTAIGKNIIFSLCRVFPIILSHTAMITRIARFTKMQ